ncbi:DUF6252 family protein [Flavobacterium notoginsengisoli]|uniref:DUF6252 family protein n=1 Tax=Flavobacterium notoginsengisoli TaxID=1478199 RepID=UPI00362B1982
MKRLLLLFFLIICLNSCDKDDVQKTPIERLPPLTSLGANTAGCLVNGEAFLPKGNLPATLFCQYIDQKHFSIAINEKINNKIRTVNVASLNETLELNKIYQLKEYGENSKFAEFVIFNENFDDIQYQTNSVIKGELKITNHNYAKAIISGTFWFDAVNDKGEKVEIREGRFDMEY